LEKTVKLRERVCTPQSRLEIRLCLRFAAAGAGIITIAFARRLVSFIEPPLQFLYAELRQHIVGVAVRRIRPLHRVHVTTPATRTSNPRALSRSQSSRAPSCPAFPFSAQIVTLSM